MDMTIIQQGRFVSDGTGVDLIIRSDVDWMRVINYTVADADQTDAVGVEYYWQRGMAADTGIEYLKSNAANAANLTNALASGGFTLFDGVPNKVGAIVALSAIDNANPPEVTTASTAGLSDGDVVRIIDVTGSQQLGGIDFTIDVTSGTTFQLEYMTPIVAGTNGFYRKVETGSPFYPRRRFISEISVAAEAVVTLTVTHGYTIGQQVRFQVPAVYGMQEINGLLGTIVDVTPATNSITVDIDSSGFTAFTFPLTAAVPFTPAQVVPVGEAAQEPYANLLDDATLNVSFIGMHLAAGEDSPAGQDGDVVYWVAGKSFSVLNN